MSRIISTEALDKEEEKSEYSLRPQYLNEYIGQEKVKDNLTEEEVVQVQDMKWRWKAVLM